MSPHYHHHHHHPYIGGMILIIIGILFLLDNLDIADMSSMIHTYWPLILVVIGLGLLLRRTDAYENAPGATTAAGPGGTAGGSGVNSKFQTLSTNGGDRVNESSTFGDVAIVLTSKNFQGGSINSVFGDTEIDATMVEPAVGEQVLRIHTVFGDTRISMPKGIPLRVTADTSFGNLRVMDSYKTGLFQHIDHMTEGYDSAGKKIHLIVSHVFGDLKVW